MRKTYLSLAVSRAWSAEMPVGDPFGGPAYGEKNGPAVALIGAGMSIYGGMAIMGTSALMGGLMIAGGVMSGLGAITGNKTLSQLGMVAGLAGGVGQFFSSGGFEAMGKAFDANGLSGVADQFTGAADFRMPGENSFSGLEIGGEGVGAATPNVTGITADSIVNTPSQALHPSSGGAFGNRASDGGSLIAPAGSTPEAALNATLAPVTPAGNNLSLEGLGGTPQTQYPNSFNKLPLEGVTSKPGIMGGLGKVGEFIEKHPMAAAMGAQVLGNGVTGAVTASAAEDKLKAEEPLRDAQTRRADAEATVLENRVNAGKGSVGQFGSNKSKGAFGGLTYDQFVMQRADAWRAAYGATSPAQQGVLA